jgi:hypothetical protein
MFNLTMCLPCSSKRAAFSLKAMAKKGEMAWARCEYFK